MLEEHPLTSPELTGDWEKRLTDIEHGAGERRRVHQGHRGLHARDRRADRRARQGEAAARARRARPLPALRRRDRRDHPGELEGLRLHELEEPRGDGLRLRDLEARRGPDDHPRDRAPAARGGQDEGGHLRLPLTAGKPFRARLVLNDEGKVEFDFPARKRKPKRPLSRNRESKDRVLSIERRSRAAYPWPVEDNPPYSAKDRGRNRRLRPKRTN